MPEMVAAVDSRGTITAWGPAAVRLLGYNPGEVMGRQVQDLLAAELPSVCRLACAASEAWRGVVVALHRDGRRLDVVMHAQPLQGADGGSLWILSAEVPGQPDGGPGAEVLKEWALAQLPMALAVGDSRARIVGVNQAFAAAAATAESELLGLRMGEREPGRLFVGAEDIPGFTEHVLHTGLALQHERHAQAPGESREHSWSTSIFPLRDQEGRVRGVGATLYDTTEQYWARRRLEVMNEASIRIGSSLDVSSTAQELAEVGTDRFADFVTVDLLDSVLRGEEAEPEPLLLRRVAQLSVLEGCPEAAVPVGQTHRHPQGSSASLALANARPSLHNADGTPVPEWATTNPDCVRSMEKYGIHSMLVVPLLARGTTLGLAQFFRHRTDDPFDADDLLLAQEITARAAVCVDNARRYTRERATAVTLQESLLPQHMPEQSAVEVASRYLPAGSRAGVGGDWFDVIPLSGARVALVVGDVVGHGLHASAAMARLRTAVRTLADVDLAPDELLTCLDDVVTRQEGEETLPADGISATCLYVVYDPVSRRCCLASAGHVLPVVAGPDGAVRFPDLPVGPPLGVGGFPFETSEFDLAEGSTLALFTDGLIETPDLDIDAGLALLGQVLERPAEPLEETCNLVLDTLLSGRGRGRPTDDIALLLARTHALDARQVAAWDLPADPAVVADARKHASDQLTAWDLDDIAFTTELVVSELVTNAIRYGGGPLQLRLIKDTVLICEVSDHSATAPHLRRARTYDEGGRGLLLVARLTDKWGSRQTSSGKVIWAEQGLPITHHGMPATL
ncbi:ATP-binding SpoIIE family protein phosphatase [Streptomyces sp.]